MTSRSLSLLVLSGIGLAAAATTMGVVWKQTAPLSAEAASSPIGLTSVSARDFKLTTASIDLPHDEAPFPSGTGADVINANCTACHSASMALTQPSLSADQWKATVTKMHEIYHAPVAENDVPAIIAYLTSMPGQKVAPPTGKAQDPDPKIAPDVSGRTG